MRTETTTRTLYTFSELAPDAQARAIADAREWLENSDCEFLASGEEA